MGQYKRRRHQRKKQTPQRTSVLNRKLALEEQDLQQRQRVDHDPLTPNNVLYFQKVIGNRAVQRMIQRKPTAYNGSGMLGQVISGMQQAVQSSDGEQRAFNQDTALEQEAEHAGDAVLRGETPTVLGDAEFDSIQARLMTIQEIKDEKAAATNTKGGFLKIKHSTSDLEKLHKAYTKAITATDWETAFTKLNQFYDKVDRMRGKDYWRSDIDRDYFLDMLETSITAERLWLRTHVEQNDLAWWVYSHYKEDASLEEIQKLVTYATVPERNRMLQLLDIRRGEKGVGELSYLLEAVDPQHRFGLGEFFRQWAGGTPANSFFADVNQLEQYQSMGGMNMKRRINYYTPLQRVPYILTITANGVQTATGGDFPNNGIYVLGRNDVFYGDAEASIIHHTSFMAGEPIKGAGHMHMTGGTLTKIDVSSGHYHPSSAQMLQTVLQLRAQGMNITNLDVQHHFGKPVIKAPAFLTLMGVV